MTVLDTSVVHAPVLMVLGEHAPVGDVMLPAGYRFAAWEPRFREPWVRLHVLLGQLPSYEEGLAYFERTYEADPVALARQMVLVVDEKEELVGTSSLWTGEHFGAPRLRVHWVGVDPAHQRRGLARALVLKTIALFDELVPSGEPALYLSTQTESWPACGMYLKLEFLPYRGPMPPGFVADEKDFEQQNDAAWRLIFEKLDLSDRPRPQPLPPTNS